MRTFALDGSMTIRLMGLALAFIVALTGIGIETGRVLGQDPSPGASAEPDPTREPDPDPTSEPDRATPRPEATGRPEPTPEPTATPEPRPDTLPDLPEVIGLRTTASRTFLRPDGSHVTELLADPAFFRPDGGTDLVAIDPGFGDPARDGTLVSDRAPTTVIVHPADDPDGLLVLRSGERRLRVHLPDGRLDAVRGLAPIAERHGRAADLPGALADADLRIVPRATGAALFLVLPERPGDGRFTLLLEAPDLEVRLTERGALELTDADGSVIASMPRPLFRDSSAIPGDDAGRTLDAVTLELDPRGERTALVLTVDPAALDAATYPAYVDLGLGLPGDPTRSGTTTLAEGFPVTTFDERTRPVAPFTSELWLGRAPGDPEATNDVLLAFPDLADLLAKAEVETATLRLTAGFQADSPRPVWIEQLVEPWRAGRATWRNRPASAPLAGDDPRQTETVQGRVEVTDVSATIRAWDRGEPGTGFLLTERDRGRAFWRRITTGDRRPIDGPRLRVVWTPTPVEATPEPVASPDATSEPEPSGEPTAGPIVVETPVPSEAVPSPEPSIIAVQPSAAPSAAPSVAPSSQPTAAPSPVASPGPSVTPAPSDDPCAVAIDPPLDPLASIAPDQVMDASPSPIAGTGPDCASASASPSLQPSAEPTVVPTLPTDVVTPLGTEVLDLRTADAWTWRQADGSMVTEFFSDPIFYRPTDGAEWRYIQPGFSVSGQDGLLVSDDAPTSVELRAVDGPPGFLVLRNRGSELGIGLGPEVAASANGLMPVVAQDGGMATYPGVFGEGTELRLFPGANGVKTFIHLERRPDSGRFRFVVDGPGVSLRADKDGSVAIIDTKGQIIGRFPRPYLYDSRVVAGSDLGRYSDDVRLEVDTADDDRPMLVIVVGEKTLASATYPIDVDPTVTYGTDTSNTNDGFVWKEHPNTSYGDHVGNDGKHQMWIGLPPGYTGTTRTYIRFLGLTDLEDARIDSAKLRVFPYYQVGSPRRPGSSVHGPRGTARSRGTPSPAPAVSPPGTRPSSAPAKGSARISM
jgi:hypothetical protein